MWTGCSPAELLIVLALVANRCLLRVLLCNQPAVRTRVIPTPIDEIYFVIHVRLEGLEPPASRSVVGRSVPAELQTHDAGLLPIEVQTHEWIWPDSNRQLPAVVTSRIERLTSAVSKRRSAN